MTAPANPFIPSPTAVNRSAPTGANIPSISLPQNHTLASDPMNQLAQTLSMGMNVPAYDPYGNNGYYSRQMAQQSPLMQRYLMPQANSQNPWLTTAMQRGMPGWTSNGDGSFKPAQYNPFQGLNTPPTQGGLPAQSGSPAGAQNPYGTVPQGAPLDQATYNAYMSNPAVKAYLDAMAAQRAQTTQYQPKAVTAPTSSLTPSPAVPGTTMNQREYDTMRFDGAQPTQQHYDALTQQSQAALKTRALLGGDPMSADVLAQGGGATGGMSSGYVNPAVLEYAKKYPNSLQAQKVAAALGPNWAA